MLYHLKVSNPLPDMYLIHRKFCPISVYREFLHPLIYQRWEPIGLKLLQTLIRKPKQNIGYVLLKVLKALFLLKLPFQLQIVWILTAHTSKHRQLRLSL